MNQARERKPVRTQQQVQFGSGRALALFPPAFTRARPGLLQRKCACGGTPGPDGKCAECRNKSLQREVTNRAETQPVPPIVNEVLRSPGQPLDTATRAFMEPRFGHDFGRVRVHTDARAAESAQAVNALAYTVGRDVVFGMGQYSPGVVEGQRLLAHELTHVVQQGKWSEHEAGGLAIGPPDDAHEQEAGALAEAVASGRETSLPAPTDAKVRLQRQMGELRLFEYREEVKARLKIDYGKAERANKRYAKGGSLGWETKLETVADRAYKAWAGLWREGKYNEFADAVARYQVDLGLPERDVDGILGPGTWYRIAGLGQAMADIKDVTWEKSEYVCTVATEERVKRGYKLATGQKFGLPEDKDKDIFNVILQSIPNRMLDVDEQYRGTGAAGALVYAGLGEFVSEADIWAGKLKPGAAIQVWGTKASYDLLRAGEVEEAGKRRRITDADASFYGTSFVFVRYDTDTNDRMLVRHYGETEWKARSDFEVWVAANTKAPE